MADYHYPNDGKLHVRFSELVRCTHGQIDRVVAERSNPLLRVQTEAMEFGTERHDSWSKEAIATGFTPKIFDELFGFRHAVTHVEQELVSEIAPGIVVHSRPDAVNAATGRVIDYKTAVDGINGYKANLAHYRTSKQGTFYAFMLAIHGIRIREVWYGCEVWNADRTKIICYESVVHRPDILEVASMRAWAIKRAALLKVALTGAARTA